MGYYSYSRLWNAVPHVAPRMPESAFFKFHQHGCLLMCDLNKGGTNRHVSMDGRKLTRPQLMIRMYR